MPLHRVTQVCLALLLPLSDSLALPKFRPQDHRLPAGTSLLQARFVNSFDCYPLSDFISCYPKLLPVALFLVRPVRLEFTQGCGFRCACDGGAGAGWSESRMRQPKKKQELAINGLVTMVHTKVTTLMRTALHDSVALIARRNPALDTAVL